MKHTALHVSRFKTPAAIFLGAAVLIGGAWYFGSRSNTPTPAEAAAIMAKLSDRLSHLQSFHAVLNHSWKGIPQNKMVQTSMGTGTKSTEVLTAVDARFDFTDSKAVKLAAALSTSMMSGATEVASANVELRTLPAKSYLRILSLKLPANLASFQNPSFLNRWMSFSKKQDLHISVPETEEGLKNASLRELLAGGDLFTVKKILSDAKVDGIIVHRFVLAPNVPVLKEFIVKSVGAVASTGVQKPSEGEIEALVMKHANDEFEVHVDDQGYPRRLMVRGDPSASNRFSVDLKLSDFDTSVNIETPAGATDADSLLEMIKPKQP